MDGSPGLMSLVSRAAVFKDILERCEITDREGAAHAPDAGIDTTIRLLVEAHNNGGLVYLVGNGGSASVASHSAVDLMNVAGLRAGALHEPSMLTCMANDYGYERAFSRMLAGMARPEDVLIAISSSGRSENICNAALKMVDQGGKVISLTGFDSNNPLRTLGDINIWLDSADYGMVEIGHQFVLHNISDRFRADKGKQDTE